MQQVHPSGAVVYPPTHIAGRPTQPAAGINTIQFQPAGATVYLQPNVSYQPTPRHTPNQPGSNSNVCSGASPPAYHSQEDSSAYPTSAINSPSIAPPSYQDATASSINKASL